MADEKRDEYGLSAADIKQIQDYMRTHDFTAEMTLQRQYNYTGKAAEVFAAAKKCITKTWEKKLYTDFGINRPMKNFSDDFAIKALENADSDYISNILAEFENNPDQLNTLFDKFTEMYSDTIAKTLEAFSKSKKKILTI